MLRLFLFISIFSLADTNSTILKDYLKEKEKIENSLSQESIWSKSYANYDTYQKLSEELISIIDRIETLKHTQNRSKKESELLEESISHKTIIEGKLKLLKEYEKEPFKKFLTSPNIGEVPNVTNPLAIIGAFSFEKKLILDRDNYHSLYISLEKFVDKLKKQKYVLEKLAKIKPNLYLEEYIRVEKEYKTFSPILDIFKTTYNVYFKTVDDAISKLNGEIKREIEKAMSIVSIVLLILFALFLIKYLIRRYLKDNDRAYTINKVLNFSFFTILILVLLLAYIENIKYIITILGFASAGIAIAMKDIFLSVLGWLNIFLGGSLRVGDRVKFVQDGTEYVGDIVDISMLRMTIHEDITLTSYMSNRRAGRIIFVPNNFVFTNMVANYSHAGLKTVWDGIDFMVTFNSDIHKASSIAKEITKKYSKGYTDITRKQLNKLRSQYSMKNTNVEPRILTLIEPYGIKISSWYLTNAYATLTLRSTISAEIISRIQKEENIELAFPSQSLYFDKSVPKEQQKKQKNIEEINE